MPEQPEPYGLPSMQSLIDTGAAWRLEGSIGRAAMGALASGECVLPAVAHRDYWGTTVPARGELEPGSIGTIDYANRCRAERGDPLLAELPDGTVAERVTV